VANFTLLISATGIFIRFFDRIRLRRLKTASLLGPAPRRSALRANRRLVSAEVSYSNDEGAACDRLTSPFSNVHMNTCGQIGFTTHFGS
jgi:hypothetical protein